MYLCSHRMFLELHNTLHYHFNLHNFLSMAFTNYLHELMVLSVNSQVNVNISEILVCILWLMSMIVQIQII